MFANFSSALSLVPIAAIFGFGYLLKTQSFLAEEQWKGLEKLSFFVLIPCLLARALMTSDLSSLAGSAVPWVALASLAAAALLLGLLFVPLTRFCKLSIASYTTIFQVGTRWNAFIPWAVIANIFGPSELALVSVVILVTVPTINIINIVVMTHLLSDGELSWASLARRVVTNPMVLSCLAGFALGLAGFGQSETLVITLDFLGEAALGMSLLCLGAGLTFTHIRKLSFLSVALVLFKVVVYPLIAYALALAAGISGKELVVVVICAAAPAASHGYILARQMGGDGPLYASALSLQMLANVITIPVILLLLLQ